MIRNSFNGVILSEKGHFQCIYTERNLSNDFVFFLMFFCPVFFGRNSLFDVLIFDHYKEITSCDTGTSRTPARAHRKSNHHIHLPLVFCQGFRSSTKSIKIMSALTFTFTFLFIPLSLGPHISIIFPTFRQLFPFNTSNK